MPTFIFLKFLCQIEGKIAHDGFFVVLPAQLAMDDDVIDLCDVKVRHGLPHDVIPSLLCKGTGSETFWIVLYGSLPYTVFLYKLVL